MESKTKHRILGIVVVAGLAVLLYPFVQGNNHAPNEQVLAKAPPFPDQAIQVSSSDTEEFANNTPADAMPAPSSGAQQIQSGSVEDVPDGAIKQEARPVTNMAEPSLVNPPPATQSVDPAGKPDEKPVVEKTSDASSSPHIDGEVIAPVVKNETDKPLAKKSVKKSLAAKKDAHNKLAKTMGGQLDKLVIHSRVSNKSNIYRNVTLDNNGLLKLKQAAYVIQLGSFRQKTNALRLVNKLRANGYRAFIQHVPASSGEGENTRVFVGPEHQQASARLVASDLEKELKLHGIVISYKPFTL
jgi:cell division septation protein DedD